MTLIQKKGDPNNLHGKLTVYAKISHDVVDFKHHNSPLYSMIKTGFLVAQGNYLEQNNLRDFLQQELGTSLEDNDGMKNFVEGLSGIEGALDPDKFREKINQLEELEEFIPTPAKMVTFLSEAEILEQEGDVFFVGTYNNPANANLAVNAITILYQSQFRESQLLKVRGEIDSLISVVENGEELSMDSPHEEKLIVEKLDKEETLIEQLFNYFLPNLRYSYENRYDMFFEDVCNDLKDELSNYPNKSDIDKIISSVKNKEYGLAELYSQKINSIIQEDFKTVSDIVKKIEQLENRDG